MKKVLAILCATALIFGLCGCRETTEETSVISWYEGEDAIVDVDNSKNKDNSDADNSADKDSNTDKNNGAGGTSSNTKIENPLKVNLKGATIVVYDVEGATPMFAPNANESKTEAAKANLLKKLQKELNCKLDVKSTETEKLKSLVSTSAAAGKALCGIINPPIHDAGYFVAANLVTDLTRVSSMDLSKDYMDRYGVLTASKIGTAKYSISAEGEGRTFVALFNKRILKEMGKSDKYIYDLVEKGKWNITEYRNLAKAAMKDLDGKPGYGLQDQWGQIIQDAETGLASCWLESMGTNMIKVDSNGRLVYNMTDPKMIDAINLVNDVIRKDGTLYREGTVDERLAAFANGRSLFLLANVRRIPQLASMKDEYGLVPIPKVDSASKYSNVIDLNSRVLMIPAGLSAVDQYNAGAFIQAFEYLYDDVLDAMEAEYENRYLFDEQSAKYWRLSAKNMKTHCEQFYGDLDKDLKAGTYHVLWDFYRGDIASAVSAIDARKAAAQKAIEDINSKIRK